MKNFKKYLTISLFIIITLSFLTGCAPKREEIKFEGDEGSISFNLKQEGKYKISTKKEDLRTSREQAAILGDGFKIGIEFDDDFGYFFKGDFKQLKEKRKNNNDYKEVTYSEMNGIQYFYPGYMCYNVILPIEGSKDYYLVLTVYGKEDTEKSAKEAIKNEELLDILNHITAVSAKK